MITEPDDRAVSALYTELQPQLVRLLTGNLRPPEWVTEEACQIAWSSLIERRSEVEPGRELGWLSTTAARAALRLLRRERMLTPGSAESVARSDLADPCTSEPEQRLELRERLAEIRRLPARQQRVVMLHGFGYEYDEIAAVTGETRRSVARQLTRARQQLARLADE